LTILIKFKVSEILKVPLGKNSPSNYTNSKAIQIAVEHIMHVIIAL